MSEYPQKWNSETKKVPGKIALIGGSGVIGSEFIKQYHTSMNLIDLSRTNGMIKDYSEEEITRAAQGCDAMILLAGKKVNTKEKQSFTLYEDNIRIVEASMKAAVTLGIKNVVLTSSRCVYDDTVDSPIKEDGKITPINFYGISKYASELVAERYARQNGIHLKILRISQVLALGSQNMIGVFIQNAKNGQALSVHANVSRDYIDVRDVCRGIKAGLVDGADLSASYNLGSGKPISILDIANTINQVFDNQVEIIADIPEKPQIFYLNVDKMNQDLHFTCKYSLDDTIKYLSCL